VRKAGWKDRGAYLHHVIDRVAHERHQPALEVRVHEGVERLLLGEHLLDPRALLGLLEARGAVLVDDGQSGLLGEGLGRGLARVDQRPDHADATLALVVRLHRTGL
jgi:hypothetical protein